MRNRREVGRSVGGKRAIGTRRARGGWWVRRPAGASARRGGRVDGWVGGWAREAGWLGVSFGRPPPLQAARRARARARAPMAGTRVVAAGVRGLGFQF